MIVAFRRVVPADFPAVRRITRDAYLRAGHFSADHPYMNVLEDVEHRAEHAQVWVAETAGQVQPAAPAAPTGCDPNYAGACVPVASDVDSAGGSGNGPAYVRGPVTVVGSDTYGLDSNRDGVGCEG